MIMLIVVCSLSIGLWKILSVWYGRRLRADTKRRRKNIERMRRELKLPREQKTLNNFVEIEEKPSEEEKELTEGQLQDEDEMLEEYD